MNQFGPPGSGSGPMISGKFINKNTGKEIFVRDSIDDGNRMQLVLSDGTCITMDEFQNYVQMSDEEYDEHGNMIGIAKTSTLNNTQSKPSIDTDLLFAGMGEQPKERKEEIVVEDTPYGVTSIVQAAPVQNKVNPKLEMINKILDKSEAPEIQVLINWPNKPEKEFDMLKTFFDVTNEDIAEAVYMKYGSENVFINAFNESISS